MFTFGVEQNNRISNIEEKKKNKPEYSPRSRLPDLLAAIQKVVEGGQIPDRDRHCGLSARTPFLLLQYNSPLICEVNCLHNTVMGNGTLLPSLFQDAQFSFKKASCDRQVYLVWQTLSSKLLCSIWGLCTSVLVSLQASVFLTHRTALSLTGHMCQASAQQKNVRTQSSATMTCKRHFPMVFYMLSHPGDYLKKKK